MILLRQSESRGLFLVDVNLARGAFHFALALEDSHGRVGIFQFHSQMGGFGEGEFFASEGEHEFFLFVALEIEVCGSFLEVDRRRPAARVAQRQLGKFNYCAGSDAQGASIFELDLRPGILSVRSLVPWVMGKFTNAFS